MTTDSWRGPFSGDVTQAINPWSWWIRGSQQAGFININTSRTDDPDMERRIVENVASYGRQLGRIVEVVQVLVAQLPTGELTPAERDAVRSFTEMAERIAAVKDAAAAAPPTVAKLDRFIADIEGLRSTDPDRYRDLVDRIRTAFPADGGQPAGSLGG
jgi:hypothetical protein